LNQAIKWPDDGIRRISITTYGFGGSNAHAILDDTFSYLKSLNTRSIPKTLSPTVTNGHDDISRHIEHHKGIVEVATKAQSEKDIPYLLVWSANDATSVRSLVHLYETYYKLNIRGKAAKLCQLAYTLSARRSLMSWRAFAIVNQLQVLDVRDILAPVKSDLTLNWSGLALVFTGQGAQYPGMGMKLMHYPVFQHALVEADAALSRLGCTWSLFGKSHKFVTCHKILIGCRQVVERQRYP
jgi:acyl transferase domain-containing protein